MTAPRTRNLINPDKERIRLSRVKYYDLHHTPESQARAQAKSHAVAVIKSIVAPDLGWKTKT